MLKNRVGFNSWSLEKWDLELNKGEQNHLLSSEILANTLAFCKGFSKDPKERFYETT